jgi:hypothetical protein
MIKSVGTVTTPSRLALAEEIPPLSSTGAQPKMKKNALKRKTRQKYDGLL